MVKRESIEFIDSNLPIEKPVTKFGGQPVWLQSPQWPISRSTGNPMRFIGQIAIEQGPIQTSPKLAYIFITDEEEYIDGTWEPDGGENAVVIQPGSVTFPVKALPNGPSVYRMVKKLFHKHLVPEPCEFAVRLRSGEDPDFVGESERMDWDDAKRNFYISAIEGNKIGGTPLFIQNDEFPKPGNWNLLLQLDSARVPFHVNFGDTGIGYIFLSEDRNKGKFLWQCM